MNRKCQWRLWNTIGNRPFWSLHDEEITMLSVMSVSGWIWHWELVYFSVHLSISISDSAGPCLLICLSVIVGFISVFCLLAFFPFAPTHILCTAHRTTHTHKHKCQAGSPLSCPQVMCSWHFIKLSAEKSHHKLFLTDAEAAVPWRSIRYSTLNLMAIF